MENQQIKQEKLLEKKTLIEHLYDVQALLLYNVIILVFTCIISYYYCDAITLLIKEKFLPSKQDLHYFSITEPFFLRVKISFITGLISSLPIITIRTLIYILPAVQKKLILCTYTILSCILFFLGITLSFLYLVPIVVDLMLKTAENNIMFLLNASSFLSTIVILLLIGGVTFQIPLVIFGLLQSNILTPTKLRDLRKVYILLSFFAGALFTPPDITSQMILAFLLIILFEITIILFSICKGTKEL